LDGVPDNSDVEDSSEDGWDDDDEDIDYIARRRDRGLTPVPMAGEGMYCDRDDGRGEDDDGDRDRDDEEEDEIEVDSDNEELPDLDESECVAGEPAKKKVRVERKTWTWKNGDLELKDMPTNMVQARGMEQCKYPVDYFLKMFGKETFEMLLEETNIYRVSKQSTAALITIAELRKVVGILMYISVLRMPNTRMFWSKAMGIKAVSNVMTRDRFEEIINLLHMSNNLLQPKSTDPAYDRLYKVRNLLVALNTNFKKNAEMEKVMAVDEQMIPFKGRLGLKVYMKNKPAKWGIKIWALAGQSGYVHSFNVFGDNLLVTEGPDGVGASGQTVLNLCENLEPGTEVFFDNYFASPGLLLALQDNRIEHCPLKSEKELKKEGRGAMDHKVSEEGVLVARWYDNKPVMVGSNHYSVTPHGRVKRWDRKQKDYIHIPIPFHIGAYNRGMGAVDRCDQLLSFYR
jgi:hypothetical protein